MSAKSAIEWTDATWNPVRGCTKISPGCAHCYAERFAERFRGVIGHPYEQGFDLRLIPEKLPEPLRWKRPKTVFVNSMSDLFHDDIPTEYIRAVMQVMRLASHHLHQVLTKRATSLRELLSGPLTEETGAPNVWWGTSVENRRHGLPRIEELRQTPVRTRFLSIEPLLEDLGTLDLTGIHWVIVGGESGGRARPMQRDWVMSILEQCREQRIPFFFKQWGGAHAKKNGRLLEGRTFDEFPERVTMPLSEQDRLERLKEMEAVSKTFLNS